MWNSAFWASSFPRYRITSQFPVGKPCRAPLRSLQMYQQVLPSSSPSQYLLASVKLSPLTRQYREYLRLESIAQ